ncbi:MAG: histidine kinase [Herbaspirillum sp.]|nr:histidine kinase [Herbaspirillum sp.]
MDSKLSAIIVHDIKNALAILEGELRQLTDAPDRTRAGHAHTICLNLQDKLVGFLTLYKASSQGLVAQIDAVSPIDFLTMLIDHLSIGKSGIALSLSAAPMPVVAFFDEHLVTLALEAALRNAMRFASSRIEVGCVQRDGFLVFSIQDDGPGVGVGAKEKIASTGLGMGLCNVIAAAHIKDENSGVAVLRNSAGGGALFELCLP